MVGLLATALPQKLGIKPHRRVALLGTPAGFDRLLGQLPEGVEVARSFGRLPFDVILLFAETRAMLEQEFQQAARHLLPSGGLWVAWPRRGSGVTTDLDEAAVREIGLAAGLVDNKGCALDTTWSALRFVVRARERPRAG